MSFYDEFFRTRDGREYTVHYGGPLRDAVLGMSVEEVYRTQPELQAVVSFIARNVAQLPLKCYTRVSDDDRPRDTDGVLPKLLGGPGGGVTTYDLVLWTISDVCIYGRYLWWVLPSADTESGWVIQHIPAGWIARTKTRDGFRPSSYVLRNPTTTGREIEVPADQFVSHVEYNPGRPVTPLSPVDALKQVLAEQASSREYRNKVWRNGGWFSRWIKRPKDAPDWSQNGGRARFAKSWKSKFAGKDGTDTGGTPLLEDGMELMETRLNAKEAEWAESMRLSREDVAAAYHVNPAQVWSNDGQTYASVKENARSLYSDTLGPYLAMMRADIECRLVPIIGADPRSYAEFDLTAKLAGSFEEQASFLSQSTGGPWMLRNEARARMNLPAIEGGDELIVPMNVTEGGLANPHDTAPDKAAVPVAYLEGGVLYALPSAAKEAGPQRVRAKGPARAMASRTTVLKSRGEPDEKAVREITKALAKFADRQAKRVLSDLPPLDGDKAAMSMAKDGDDPEWWDAERWDRELADDLTPILQQWATMRAIAALADLGLPPHMYDLARTVNFVRSMAESRARAYNSVTLDQLKAVYDGSAPEGKGSTPEGIFEMAATSRAERSGVSFATSAASFGTTEAARQAYPKDTDEVRRFKVWRHMPSDHPRPKHARMDGERVGLDEKFSNGADWPGDDVLGPAETCNCHCQVEIVVEKAGSHRRRIDEMEVIHEGLYDETPEQIKKEIERIGKDERSTWENGYRKSDRSPTKYRETYGAFIESFSPEGRIKIEDFTRIEPKEIQLAKWLASAGHTVEFRNADDHRKTDGKTTDVFLDGVLWEFKRSESKSAKKLATLITKRIDRQGPKFVVDLSVSQLDRGVALEKLANLLDDPNIERFMVIADGVASVMRK